MTRTSPLTIKPLFIALRGRMSALASELKTREPRNSGRGSRGFTLIELMVVMALLGLMSIFVIPSISSYFRVSLNSTAREMAGIIKETYNSAVVTGKVHRLVYDLGKKQYWVETGPATALLDTKQTREREERKKRFAKDSEAKSDSPFELAKGVTRKKLSLPSGVIFEDVFTEKSAGESNEALTQGVAYTHFFPNGLIEQTIIHLKDESKHQVSLVILPLIGQTDFYERYMKPEEVFGK